MTEEFKPVFDFSGEMTSDEGIASLLEAAEGNSRGGDTSKVLRPGNYDLAVGEVKILGAARQDSSWMNVRVILNGTGELSHKTISKFLLVPMTSRLSYQKEDGSESGFPLKQLLDTLSALGIQATPKQIPTIVQQNFAPEKLGALVGRNVSATVGYNKPHAKYVRDEGAEEGHVVIQGREGPITENGAVVKFTGDDAYSAAEKYAKDNSITFQSFAEILSLSATAANSGDSAVNGDW